jgi:hypothetical protein
MFVSLIRQIFLRMLFGPTRKASFIKLKINIFFSILLLGRSIKRVRKESMAHKTIFASHIFHKGLAQNV